MRDHTCSQPGPPPSPGTVLSWPPRVPPRSSDDAATSDARLVRGFQDGCAAAPTRSGGLCSLRPASGRLPQIRRHRRPRALPHCYREKDSSRPYRPAKDGCCPSPFSFSLPIGGVAGARGELRPRAREARRRLLASLPASPRPSSRSAHSPPAAPRTLIALSMPAARRRPHTAHTVTCFPASAHRQPRTACK